MYNDREITISAAVGDRVVVLRSPGEPADRPALLINLATDRYTSLDDSPYRIIPDIFLAVGHRVVSFDLPKHGELADGHGAGLQGMANAVSAGENPFREIRQVGRALVELAEREAWAYNNAIVTAGTSRGGLSALHLYAESSIVCAAGVLIPVTHLPALTEFSGMAGHPVVQQSNAEALIPELRDRPLIVSIGETDNRVDATKCRGFVEKLSAASSRNIPVFVTGPGQTHGDTFPIIYAYQAVAGFLLRHAAERVIQ